MFYGCRPRESWREKKVLRDPFLLYNRKSLSHVCHALLCCIPHQIMVSHSHMEPGNTYYLYPKMSMQNLKSLPISVLSKNKKTRAVFPIV